MKRVLRADLGLVARAIVKHAPRRRAALAKRLRRYRAKIAAAPSVRAVLTWETDANDMTLHLGADEKTSRGALYEDVTNGFGPECAVVPRKSRLSAQPLRVRYTARGPMGFGLGTVSVLRHDGRGGLRFEDRPFVIMKDRGAIALGALGK